MKKSEAHAREPKSPHARATDNFTTAAWTSVYLTIWLMGAELSLAVEQSDEAGAGDVFNLESLFEKGKFETSFSSGVLFGPVGAPKGRPTINYTMTSLRLGYVVNQIWELGWFRGNCELIGEGFGSGIFMGPGNYIAGATLWGRYNFVQKGWPLTPYIQGGAGLTSTDIDHGIVGQDFNFNLDLGCGIRYFIGNSWSVFLEYQYQHISNANLGPHNLGINSQGPILGISLFF
jgi:hypothetical protein